MLLGLRNQVNADRFEFEALVLSEKVMVTLYSAARESSAEEMPGQGMRIRSVTLQHYHLHRSKCSYRQSSELIASSAFPDRLEKAYLVWFDVAQKQSLQVNGSFRSQHKLRCLAIPGHGRQVLSFPENISWSSVGHLRRMENFVRAISKVKSRVFGLHLFHTYSNGPPVYQNADNIDC